MENAKPTFSGRKKVPLFYELISGIVSIHRDKSTLQQIADLLNSQNLYTATDKPWNRKRVSNFIRTSMNKNKE